MTYQANTLAKPAGGVVTPQDQSDSLNQIHHPRELRDEWDLTYTQLACALQKSHKTIEAYLSQEQARSHRIPPASVIALCQELHYRWSQQGRPDLRIINY